MTMDASRIDGATAERRRFLAALGGLAGALGIAAAFVFVPAQAPRLPAAPASHVMLPQPAPLQAPSMRLPTGMHAGVRESSRHAPAPRAEVTRAPHRTAAPLPHVAGATLAVGAPASPPAAGIQSVRIAAVRLDLVTQPPVAERHAHGDGARVPPAPAAAAPAPDGDRNHRGAVTGALAAAGSHVGDGFRTVGDGFRTVGRALKRVF